MSSAISDNAKLIKYSHCGISLSDHLGMCAGMGRTLRPTSTSVVLVSDVRVFLVRMLCSNRACAQGERAGRRAKVDDSLYKDSAIGI